VGILQALTRILVSICFVFLFLSARPALAQRGGTRSGQFDSMQADTELQRGIALSRKGQFQEAIPHLRAAQAQAHDSYAAAFNLALCYVATQQFGDALTLLQDLRVSHDTAEVENLLAQSYIGVGQTDQAFRAEQRSAELAPKNEKLYIFAADACMENGNYELGLKLVTMALKSLPNSARLAFEQGMFLSQMDQLDIARPDFRRVQELAPDTEIAYIARAQQALFEGNMAEASNVAREAIEKGNTHFLLLTIFGEATLAAGAAPGQPAFADAQEALERVVTAHPNFSGAQLSLGKLYLAANRINDAIAHLEAARKLDSGKAAVYANLATAYRRGGDTEKANEAIAALAKLNQEQVEKIASSPGERKAGYASPVASKPPNL
jgi:tetratricopeptide (TPR) repeat protein